MWSIGCIFAEMMMKSTLFPGSHNLKQMDKIVEVLGTPDDSELEFITNENTLNYVKKLPKTGKKIKWEEKIPGITPNAIDLLN